MRLNLPKINTFLFDFIQLRNYVYIFILIINNNKTRRLLMQTAVICGATDQIRKEH